MLELFNGQVREVFCAKVEGAIFFGKKDLTKIQEKTIDNSMASR
jgi:hypothetical protein